MNDLFLLELLLLSFNKKFFEVTLSEEFLDNALTSFRVNKIVNDLDNELMREILHEPDFFS
jgi:hypothetical protein